MLLSALNNASWRHFHHGQKKSASSRTYIWFGILVPTPPWEHTQSLVLAALMEERLKQLVQRRETANS